MAYLVLLLALGSVMGLPPRNPNEFDTSPATARPSTTTKSCRDPGYPEHGYRHSTDFTYGARVYYYCNDGYQLIGESYRTCESNQEWTGILPSCREINDEGTAMTTDEVGSGEIQVEETKPLHENILDILKKGEYDYETIPSKPIDREIVVDGDVKLTENNPPPPAETDYIIYRPPSQPNTDRPVTYPYPKTTTATQAAPIGARIVVHRQRPTTSDFVNPNRVSVATSPPNLYNKKHLQRPSTKDRDTSSGSQPIETDYFPGKEQYGNDYYTKDVVPTRSKIETLDIDDADSLQVDSGREDLDESSGSGSGFSSGEIVDEEIEVGLFTTPPVIEYCGAPPLIENAENDGTGVPYYDGTDVTYTCFEGYVGQGVPTMTCRDGSWTMTTLRAQFKCVVKPCPEPPVPENGYKQGEDYDVGSYIFLNCNEGYELDGEHYRSCLSNQTWSGELPDCRRKLCADPGDVPNGYRQGFVNTYDATVFYFCNEGYELMGSSNLTCRADQSWSAARPICRERSCGSPREIENGYYSGSDFRTGGRVFYYCNDGFHLVGDNYMYCGTDRRWSGEPPSCIAKSCGEPGRIENGYRVGDDFSVGARVNFYCNQGFELVGEHFRTCLIDEEWSDVVPICKEQEELIIDNNTDDPTAIPTAIVGVTDDEDLLTDIGSGTWPSGFGSGFDFVCDETTCKYGGVCFPSAVQYQCVCNFTCENSPAEVTCGSDGHVYGNKCEIRLAACKTQRLITSAPNNVCDELSVEQVLPHCGMETNEPGWSDWSLWIRSGSKDIRFRHCRSDKARPDSRSHCAGHDIQTRLCPKERTNVCQSENGTLGYDYRYKCKGVDGHDLPDSSEVFMGNSSYDDCWFSLYTVKNSRYKYFHWSFSKLMEEGNVQNWCHKRNQFIPFYPAHGYCEMALHYFCHSQSKCWYEDEKEQSKPGDRLDTCWTTFAFGGRPPTVFEEVKSSQIVICQKFSSKSSFGTMFEDTTSHFATLYDTSTRIPVFSMTKVERLSDGGWPVVPYLLERGLVDEGQFISWLFSTPEKGLSSQYELPNKLKEDLCKLGRNQALYDDYKLSGFRVGPLLSPDLSGCHTASKVASFALTNSVPMHLTQYYAWTSAMESVKDYAAKQCGVSVERDHTGVYCQQPEDVKASLFLVSGAVASYDPREVIGNNVNVPAMVWLAGCCVQTDGSRVRSFAFYLMNKIDFPVRKVPVAELETLLTVMSNPNVASELPVKVFPASQGICGNPQNDDTSHLIV